MKAIHSKRLWQKLQRVLVFTLVTVVLASSFTVPVQAADSSSYMGDGFYCLQELGKVYNNWPASGEMGDMSNGWPCFATTPADKMNTWFKNAHGCGYTKGNDIWASLGSAYETTGTWTVPSDGEYVFILVGGSSGGVRLSCTDKRATGGTGAVVVASKTLTAGTTFTYEVGDGNVPFIQRQSFAYNYWTYQSGDGIMGQQQQHTILYSSTGKELLKAGGGTAGAMFCGDNEDDADDAKDNLGRGSDKYDYSGTDDAVSVGAEGNYSIDSSFTKLTGTTNGTAGKKGATANSVSLNLPLTVNAEVTNFINTYINITTGASRPGLLLIYKKCTHQIETTTSGATCIKSGTVTEKCKLCGATRTKDSGALGHDFKSIALGTSGYECKTNSVYYTSSSNASTNTTTAKYTGAAGYYYTKECSRCKGKAEPKPGYYHITYKKGDYGSGNDVADNNKLITAKYTTKGSLFTRTGYLQSGWDKHSNGGSRDYLLSTQYDSLSSTPTTIYLYPTWNPITYTVKYNLCGQFTEQYNGSVTPTVTCTYDKAFNLWGAGNIIRTGYTQQGWSTTKNASTNTYSLSQSVKNLANTQGANVNLYPVWKENSYKVRYHNDVDNTYVDQSCPYTKECTSYLNGVNMNFVKEGYYVAYWSTKDGSLILAADPLKESQPTNAVSKFKELNATDGAIIDVYPHWEPISYYIQYVPYSSSTCTGSAPTGTNSCVVPTPKFNNTLQVTCTLGNKTFKANKSNASSLAKTETINAVKYTYNESYTVPANAYSNSNSMGFESTFMGWALGSNDSAGCLQPGDTIKNVTPQRNQIIKLYSVFNQYPVLDVRAPGGVSYNTTDGSESILKQLLETKSGTALSGTQLEAWLLQQCVNSATDKEDGKLAYYSNVYVSYFSKEVYNGIDRPTLLTVTFTAEDSLGQCTHVTTYWEIYSNGRVDILID